MDYTRTTFREMWPLLLGGAVALVVVVMALRLTIVAPGHDAWAATTTLNGHIIKDSAGANQVPRTYLKCVDVSCTDDSANNQTKLTVFGGPTALYVCQATGSPCFTSVSNAGTSPTATVPCVQDALDKLGPFLSETVTIHIASTASVDYACPNTTVEMEIYQRTAPIVIRKYVAGGKYLILQGYFNPTANLFTNASQSSGTSSAAATNDFPVTGAGAVGTTTFTDSTKAWAGNTWVVDYLHITGGTGYDTTNDGNNWYIIQNNSATVLTLNMRWTGAVPDATTTYEIFDRLNHPVIASSGNTAAVILSSENVVMRSLRLGVPTGCSGQNCRSLWVWRSRLNFEHGDFGVNAHQSSGTYAVYQGAQSIYAGGVNYVADCGPMAYCVYNNVDMQNWQHFTILATQNAFLWIKNSHALTGTAGVASRGVVTAWLGGSAQIEGSLLSIPSGGVGLLLRDSGSFTIFDKNRISCASNAAGNTGIIATFSSALITEGPVNRVDSCDVGVRTGIQSTWYASATPTYSGNTTNEVTHASGTKTTTLY